MNRPRLSWLIPSMCIVTALGTGCAGTSGPPPASTDRWQRMTLADGVELHVSDNAGPEAVRVAEQIQSEMRSRYLGARQ